MRLQNQHLLNMTIRLHDIDMCDRFDEDVFGLEWSPKVNLQALNPSLRR
jgi:hypothetical protein